MGQLDHFNYTMHHQGLWMCLGAFRITPGYSLDVEASEPFLSNRKLRLTLNYHLTLYSVVNSPAYNCIVNVKYVKKDEAAPHSIPPLGICILPNLQKADIDRGVISDDSKILENPTWMFASPEARFDLATQREKNLPVSGLQSLLLELC